MYPYLARNHPFCCIFVTASRVYLNELKILEAKTKRKHRNCFPTRTHSILLSKNLAPCFPKTLPIQRHSTAACESLSNMMGGYWNHHIRYAFQLQFSEFESFAWMHKKRTQVFVMLFPTSV